MTGCRPGASNAAVAARPLTCAIRTSSSTRSGRVRAHQSRCPGPVGSFTDHLRHCWKHREWRPPDKIRRGLQGPPDPLTSAVISSPVRRFSRSKSSSCPNDSDGLGELGPAGLAPVLSVPAGPVRFAGPAAGLAAPTAATFGRQRIPAAQRSRRVIEMPPRPTTGALHWAFSRLLRRPEAPQRRRPRVFSIIL